jgi:hypothetical protein
VHPNLRIPSKRVSSLKLLSDPSSASGQPSSNCALVYSSACYSCGLSKPFNPKFQEKQTPEPHPFPGPGQSGVIRRI